MARLIVLDRHKSASMDSVNNFDYADDQVAPLGQLITALLDGVSVLITAPSGTALLAAAAPVLARTRIRVLLFRSPRDLEAFMDRAPSAVSPSGTLGLEHGFSALTVLDATCDRIALLVDNAHLLSHNELHFIELALGAAPQLSVTLAGQPELEHTLALNDFSGLNKRLKLRLGSRASQSPSSVAGSRRDRNQHRAPTGTDASLSVGPSRTPNTQARAAGTQYSIPGQHADYGLPNGVRPCGWTRSGR